jgi:hypothetical protein
VAWQAVGNKIAANDREVCWLGEEEVQQEAKTEQMSTSAQQKHIVRFLILHQRRLLQGYLFLITKQIKAKHCVLAHRMNGSRLK